MLARQDQSELTVRYADDERPPCLSVAGELDIGTAPVLREALLRLLADTDVEDVIVDLSGVTFVDSSGLAVLLMAARRWAAEEDRLIVRNPSRVVDRIFDLTGVRAAFAFED